LALVELSIVEQRYRAVLAVEAGATVSEVARQVGVSRQTLHAWLARYRQAGLGGLVDRSKRPDTCPIRSRRSWRPPSVSCAGSIPAGAHAGSSTSWAAADAGRACRRG
jgi:hypothetical protein